MPERTFSGTFDDAGLTGAPGPAGPPGQTGSMGPAGPPADPARLAALEARIAALEGAPPVEPPPVEPPPVVTPPVSPPVDATLHPGDDVQGWLDSHPGGTVRLEGLFERLSVWIRHDATIRLAPGTALDGKGDTSYAIYNNQVGSTLSIIGEGTRPVVRNYLASQQDGAIRGDKGHGWLVENIEVTNTRNNGNGAGAYGISIGNAMTVRDCKLTWNASLGIGGDGSGTVLIESNEIAYNNWKVGQTQPMVDTRFATAPHHKDVWWDAWTVDPGWEGGGSKFVLTNGLILRGNHAHHNAGVGLWTDIGNVDTLMWGNLCEYNAANGISHELSYRAEIANNTARYNGLAFMVWGWGGQIMVQNSPDVHVHDNAMTVSAKHGNGLISVHQERNYPPEWVISPGVTTAYGVSVGDPLLKWDSVRNRFIDNTITYEGPGGSSGFFDDASGNISVQPGMNEWTNNVETRP